LYDHTPSSSTPATPRTSVQHSAASAAAASTAASARTPTAFAAVPLQQPAKQAAGCWSNVSTHHGGQQLRPSPKQQQQQQQQQQHRQVTKQVHGWSSSCSSVEGPWASCRGSRELQPPWAAAAAAAASAVHNAGAAATAAGTTAQCKVASLVDLGLPDLPVSPLDRAISGGSMPLSPTTPAAAAGHSLHLQRSLSKSSSPASACGSTARLSRAWQLLPAAPWQQQQQQELLTSPAMQHSPAAAYAPQSPVPQQLLRPAQPPASSSLYHTSRAAVGAAAHLSGTAITAYPALVAAAPPLTAGTLANHNSPTPAAGSSKGVSSSDDVSAEVSRWLLRAALLEDELQGRALEVAEALSAADERREEVEALLLSMAGCRGPGGGAAAAGGGGGGATASRLDTTW
jgi:hypothetical protein